jgi:hypothetical protein
VTCRDWFQLTLKEGLTVYRVGLPRVQLRYEQPPRLPCRNCPHSSSCSVP